MHPGPVLPRRVIERGSFALQREGAARVVAFSYIVLECDALLVFKNSSLLSLST